MQIARQDCNTQIIAQERAVEKALFMAMRKLMGNFSLKSTKYCH